MYFSLCFVCPARFCEITENMLCNVAFLKHLLSPRLNDSSLLVSVDSVMLDYSQKEHMYYVCVLVYYYTSPESAANDIEEMKLKLEGHMSQLLLQCFWEVSAFGC